MFRDTAAALVEADPLGLAGEGGPADEYDTEAAEILRRVLEGTTSEQDVQDKAVAVLDASIGIDYDRSGLAAFAATVWRRYGEVTNDA